MNETNYLLKKERVIVYVDGFNLYFGMLESGIKGKWLNLIALANALLKPNQELVAVKYFTSRVGNDPEKQKRQTIYIEALETVNVQIFFGHYQKGSTECLRCGNKWMTFNEKMTDVNIATHLLIDAFQDNYDMAMLISGDSDLVPPIKNIHQLFTDKRVFVAFPPHRHNSSLSLVAKGSLIIGRKKILVSQFPSTLIKESGFILNKPKEWL